MRILNVIGVPQKTSTGARFYINSRESIKIDGCNKKEAFILSPIWSSGKISLYPYYATLGFKSIHLKEIKLGKEIELTLMVEQ